MTDKIIFLESRFLGEKSVGPVDGVRIPKSGKICKRSVKDILLMLEAGLVLCWKMVGEFPNHKLKLWFIPKSKYDSLTNPQS